MTTKPDINAIAREAANTCTRRISADIDLLQLHIAEAIRCPVKEDFETAKAIERGAALEAIRQRDEAIDVLKSVEWVIKTSYGSTCPVCLWWNETGHKPDCKLAKAIGK